MRLSGDAAIVGIAELPAQRRQTRPELFTLDQYAALAKQVVEDAGLDAALVNGLLCHGLAESDMFVPATLSEYLGLPLDFGERVDLGGATSAGMVWRAAVAGPFLVVVNAMTVVGCGAEEEHLGLVDGDGELRQRIAGFDIVVEQVLGEHRRLSGSGDHGCGGLGHQLLVLVAIHGVPRDQHETAGAALLFVD